MIAAEVVKLYMCPRDLVVSEGPGACKICGREFVECCPGGVDDPCRRPVMDAHGRVLTRAPLWWLQHSVATILAHLDED